MSISDMLDRFKSGQKRVPGPLSEAIQVARQTISAADKAGVNPPLAQALKVILHSFKAHRDALEAGAAVLNLIDQADPKWNEEQQKAHAELVRTGISIFKEYAVKARVQQYVDFGGMQ